MQHRIGNQAQPKTKEEETALKGHPGVGCDGCNQGVKDRTRFKCLTCMDLDLCRECHEKVDAGDRELAEGLKAKGHNVNSHTVQRYCFAQAK